MSIKNYKRIINLTIVGRIVDAYGKYEDFKLAKRAIEFQTSYQEAEKISEIISLVTKKEISPSELIFTEDEKVNDIIDKYNDLKKSYADLKSIGISKKNSNKIFSALSKTILKLPEYFVSVPRNCTLLSSYICGEIDNSLLEKNFIKISILGNHEIMNRRIFYKIYNSVLEEYQKTIKKPYERI
jgi:hypothetical protein